ncbi:hypothetical protein NicSoilB4_36900 (plasmid) [Arthrobacter sp. NicSoilB4]|nr:hypothetical protein NicSoilB4_36900 [Arthrobacter sp. NicSoilB4]
MAAVAGHRRRTAISGKDRRWNSQRAGQAKSGAGMGGSSGDEAKGMLAGLAHVGASAGAAGCRVQGVPSQGSGPPWPCSYVFDAFWLLSFGF